MEKCKLPTLTELWWYYQYDFVTDRIALNLCYAEDIELEDDEEEISTETTRVEHTLFSIKCDYITVEEFAKLQEVTPIAVRFSN